MALRYVAREHTDAPSHGAAFMTLPPLSFMTLPVIHDIVTMRTLGSGSGFLRAMGPPLAFLRSAHNRSYTTLPPCPDLNSKQAHRCDCEQVFPRQTPRFERPLRARRYHRPLSFICALHHCCFAFESMARVHVL